MKRTIFVLCTLLVLSGATTVFGATEPEIGFIGDVASIPDMRDLFSEQERPDTLVATADPGFVVDASVCCEPVTNAINETPIEEENRPMMSLRTKVWGGYPLWSDSEAKPFLSVYGADLDRFFGENSFRIDGVEMVPPEMRSFDFHGYGFYSGIEDAFDGNGFSSYEENICSGMPICVPHGTQPEPPVPSSIEKTHWMVMTDDHLDVKKNDFSWKYSAGIEFWFDPLCSSDNLFAVGGVNVEYGSGEIDLGLKYFGYGSRYTCEFTGYDFLGSICNTVDFYKPNCKETCEEEGVFDSATIEINYDVFLVEFLLGVGYHLPLNKDDTLYLDAFAGWNPAYARLESEVEETRTRPILGETHILVPGGEDSANGWFLKRWKFGLTGGAVLYQHNKENVEEQQLPPAPEKKVFVESVSVEGGVTFVIDPGDSISTKHLEFRPGNKLEAIGVFNIAVNWENIFCVFKKTTPPPPVNEPPKTPVDMD